MRQSGILPQLPGKQFLRKLREICGDFGVTFDTYFSEKELYENDGVAQLLDNLQKQEFIYSDGETLWFKTTAYGDEKDRVVVRKNGEPTYFAADIAYHQNKYARGYKMIIDVWGADHHGYMPRLWAGIQALGQDKESLKINSCAIGKSAAGRIAGGHVHPVGRVCDIEGSS